MGTLIMGTALATVEQMRSYIRRVNPSVPQKVIDMLPFYLSEGQAEGVRGDIAFCQSCIETGNFGFKGSAVTLDQNNFAGIGVTSNGMKGNSWDTPQLGIRAQVQHLKAYGSTEPLEQDCVDPRFEYVKRNSAPFVEWLGIQENPLKSGWAKGKNYGNKILTVLESVLQEDKGDNAMRVFLSVGHSILKSGACTSASGEVQEYAYCKALAPYVKKYLEQAGASVDLVICPEGQFSKAADERDYKIPRENAGNYDLACELHLNCFNGAARGTETYYKTSRGKVYADRVNAKLATLFPDRGVKTQNLYMLNQTKAPAILIEVFFCDSKADYLTAKNEGYDKIGRLIAEGIMGKTISSSDKVGWIQQNGRWWYRHADGSYTKSGWEKIGGTWYYFDAAGWMKTGWVLLGDKWYYLKSSGAMASDEIVKLGKETFYLTPEGHMGTTNSRGALV
ncbi:N-acetylmuramoyl-L-alanine amidase [Lactonifactor sp. BIOML-A4]|uniref:N-acetylmuramoyl-L-alanine amidase n=1 Tax=unclassified Lactonifactor TaxID=2636670 RepID=UPI00325B65F1